MKTINTINQLKLLILLPMIIITIGFILYISSSYKVMNKSEKLLEDIKEIQKVATIIYALQIERGLSSGYIGSNAKEFKDKLLKQHKKVDFTLKEIDFTNKNIKLNRLSYIRKDVLSLSMKSNNTFSYYTRLIDNMKLIYLNSTDRIEDYEIRNSFIIYKDLINLEEFLSQLRGSINTGLAQGFIDETLYQNIINSKNMYDYSLVNFELVVRGEMRDNYHYIISNENYHWAYKIILQAVKDNYLDIDPNIWFSKTTEIIENLHKQEELYIDIISAKAKSDLEYNELKFVLSIIFLLVVSIVMLFLSYKLSKKISKKLKLLDEYKNAVDRSSIVSKTNKEGIITYTNEAFCKISGYTYEELIGRPHNVVRHPDMPKDAFKDMWKTVLSKKAWSGVVKNRKKDGDFYWVEVTINPILDEDGNIEEFIAIRTDITDNFMLHKEIEKTQEDLIIRMGEIGETRSRETGFHVRRVAKYSEILATKYGLNENEILYLTNASPMHDIGKVGIPDYILNKPGKLTKEEWEIMKTHSEIGYDLFKDSDKPLLKAASIIAHQHHEKYDGSGYPQGLVGNDIHIYGRISAIADVFDALGSERPYKKAWSNEKIFSLLKEERGKHFDPVLIDIFFEHLEEFLEIQRIYNGQSDYMNE